MGPIALVVFPLVLAYLPICWGRTTVKGKNHHAWVLPKFRKPIRFEYEATHIEYIPFYKYSSQPFNSGSWVKKYGVLSLPFQFNTSIVTHKRILGGVGGLAMLPLSSK